MDVPLDQKVMTADTKQGAATQLNSNNVESGIGDLRRVAGHQAERADSMLPIEAMKYSANTIACVSHKYEHYAGQVVGPKQVLCNAFQCDSTCEEK